MIMIRHIEGRRSERIAWLLEELGIPYELDYIAGDVPGSLLALEQHHEMRMTPIVEDGDVVMVESSAIIEYLLAKYGKGSSLRPAEDAAEYLLAGAAAIQVGTATFLQPAAMTTVIDGLRAFCLHRDIPRIADLVVRPRKRSRRARGVRCRGRHLPLH